jgi:hypothetical protein
VRNVLLLERRQPPPSVFQGEHICFLFQIGLHSWGEETHDSIQRKPGMLDTGTSTALFSCGNWLSFWKKDFFEFTWLMLEISDACSNWPIQLRWRNTCVSRKKSSMLQAVASSTFFPVRLEVVFERNTLWSHRFQDGESFILYNVGLYSWVGETHVSLQRKPSK